ncbi:CLUMA_CG005013, isoform A [Clunio marinus]|uniref:CLUMA_CG005013, isoform A n=1 Tax=Clunio marinus TaxID=568069 RepID=A0A1J1HTM0_9DIPT|nr:CLUMA_CG005013, isoform A [Clunio marinus]
MPSHLLIRYKTSVVKGTPLSSNRTYLHELIVENKSKEFQRRFCGTVWLDDGDYSNKSFNSFKDFLNKI